MAILNKMIDPSKKFIFIDFDGTLVKTISGYTMQTGIVDSQPIWNTWNSLRDWAKARIDKKQEGYIMIVSNQGGIEARKGSSEHFLKSKFEYYKDGLQEYLDKKMTYIKTSYIYCPSNDKSNPNRKPNAGMLSRSLVRFGFDPATCNKAEMVMIGDASGINYGSRRDFSDSDAKAAMNFGIEYIDVASV